MGPCDSLDQIYLQEYIGPEHGPKGIVLLNDRRVPAK